jgi:hypothetical protein
MHIRVKDFRLHFGQAAAACPHMPEPPIPQISDKNSQNSYNL